MCATDFRKEKKKHEFVAPDGGWGYMIAVAVVINISTTTAFASSYGLLYKEFLQEIGRNSTSSSLMLGLSAIFTAISGFLTSPMLSIMSVRMLTLAATLIFNSGVICIMFVKSAFTFHLCYGILQGFGFGLIYNLSFTALTDYFVKKRLMAISLVHSLVVVILMVTPLFVKWSLVKYGFRDTILIMSGLTMHNFIAVALMQPVKWHMKRIDVPDGGNVKLLHEKKVNEETSVAVAVVPIIKLTNTDGNLSNLNEKLYLASKSDESARINFRKIINFLLDKSLCEKFLMSCVCAGPALAMFADSTYSSILPQALFTARWVQNDVALAQTLYEFGDLTMGVLFAVLSNWLLKLGSQEIYVLGVTLGLVSRFGMLWSKSFIAVMVYMPLVGASHCAVTILVPLVVADAVAPEKFTAALGMLMMLLGLVNLVLGPAIGSNLYVNTLIERLSSTHVGCHIGGVCLNNISYADDIVLLSASVCGLSRLVGICEKYDKEHELLYNTNKNAVRELSESYGPVFYLIVSCFAIIVLFWSIELCYKKNKHKRLQRREYLRQKKLNK